MQELNQFCHKYLPEHFASKYNECKLKEHFFEYRNEGNVYELTGKNLSLLDKLLAANPSLQASKIIEKYFIFTIMEFKKYRKDKEIAQENDVKCKTRQSIRQILKSMKQNDRMCFQLFMRLAYFYFESIETKNQKNKLKKQVEIKETKKVDYFDQISAFYLDVRFLAMTQDDSFNLNALMQYCISILLNLNPNQNFFKLVNRVLDECGISETYRDRINDKIEMIKKNQLINTLKSHKNNTPHKKESSNSQNSILEPKNQNLPLPNNMRPNELTPIKAKSANKSQRKTHETSQKKEYIDNKKEQEPNTLNALKMTLQLQKNRSFKERTLYSRKTYLMPKKASNILDQASSAGSNQNNNNEELFLIDFNRSYSSRYIDFQNDEDEDFLVGATPKPKKKVKMEKTYTGTFDQNGNFVPGM